MKGIRVDPSTYANECVLIIKQDSTNVSTLSGRLILILQCLKTWLSISNIYYIEMIYHRQKMFANTYRCNVSFMLIG